MAEIEIFLCTDEAQKSFLSIPRSDIQRLAVSPFRWLRYVMFAICGARGELSTTPNGPAVNYDETEIPDNENAYYYRPSGSLSFVDYQGLNDKETSSELTARRGKLRHDVIKRDGPVCVITRERAEHCVAAHLIPHSKGDEYIQRVMQLRSPGDRDRDRDGSVPRIDMAENGIFLSKILRSELGIGDVAFIKTPNYGLELEHIKRFPRGNEREVYITLQWITKPVDYDPNMSLALQATQNAGIAVPPSMAHDSLQSVDALFQGKGVPLPFTVVLDFLYGIAAYKAWHSNRGDGYNQMRAYHNEHYAQIPPPLAPPDDINTDASSEPDDPNDPDYEADEPGNRHPSIRRGGLEETMDELSMVLMYFSGITPEMAAERREKEIEREEQAAQEASRSKVTEWRNHLDVYEMYS